LQCIWKYLYSNRSPLIVRWCLAVVLRVNERVSIGRSHSWMADSVYQRSMKIHLDTMIPLVGDFVRTTPGLRGLSVWSAG
jgi:hypothetical protein